MLDFSAQAMLKLVEGKSFHWRCIMSIDTKSINKMKTLVKKAKDAGKVMPFEKALEVCPPEDTWVKDDDGKITVK